MLNDMRSIYTRGTSFSYGDSGSLLEPKMIAVLFFIIATLLYISFRLGGPIGVNEAAALYAP